MRRLFASSPGREFPSSGRESAPEPGGALGQFSHNNSGAGSPDGIDDPNGDCFSLINFFFSFFGTDSFFQGGPYCVPGNRPCTGEVPVPDKGRTAGGPCAPPTPRKKTPPPLKNLFSVLGQGRRRTELGGAGQGQGRHRPDQPPCQVDTGPGCSQGPGPLHPSPRFSLSGSR